MENDELLEEEILKEFGEEEETIEDNPPFDLDELTKEELFSETMINYLINLEKTPQHLLEIEKIKDKAREFRALRPFNSLLKAKMEEKKKQEVVKMSSNGIVFPEMDNILYQTNRFILEDNKIYEIIPDVGKILVCYHPILPVQLLQNLEDDTYKVKLGYYIDNEWKYIIVDKSTISSSQTIVRLSDFGIKVTSENAKFLVKYLTEIESLNQGLISRSVSVSRLGWFDGELIPYSKKYEIDNAKDMPNLEDMFGEKGKLEDWIEFLKEKRKYNSVSRIIMASSVASILLENIKQPGFTLHIYGESEYGKTVACMVAQSMFGNPAQDGKGIGINFNFTINGLESALNKYNNIPMFVNEMQHQKDAKDYDNILFLVSEGKGKTRSTKGFGIARQNNWHNVVITNGEKNIIKDNSNAGAYNRCFAYELKDYSFENLAEVADFVKDNYGTPIRKILEKINDFDVKNIYKEKLKELEEEDTTNKQKIIQALILTGDKIVTDILFKDEYYLTIEDLLDSVVKKALSIIKDWYVSELRHFWNDEDDNDSADKRNLEVYGRKISENKVAFISSILKTKLENNGFDSNETINAWKRKDYLDRERNKNTKKVRINGEPINCIVLNFKDEDSEDTDLEEYEEIERPF